jgi:hypothetical protein
MMLTIAGGILLAVLVLILLPWLLAGAAWVAGITLVIAIAGGAIWALWTGAQSVAGLAVELTIGAVFLIWLYFERKPKREPVSGSGWPHAVILACMVLMVAATQHYLRAQRTPDPPNAPLPPGEYVWTPEKGVQPKSLAAPH